jgi:hypothetical protein
VAIPRHHTEPVNGSLSIRREGLHILGAHSVFILSVRLAGEREGPLARAAAIHHGIAPIAERQRADGRGNRENKARAQNGRSTFAEKHAISRWTDDAPVRFILPRPRGRMELAARLANRRMRGVTRGFSAWVGLAALLGTQTALAQLDSESRKLIQLGYNQPLEGRAPIAGYGFFYYNKPDFMRTNLTLRLAVAPIYADSELGFKGVLTPNTDLGIGLAGGGFADSFSEIRGGKYFRDESFTGHGGEIGSSIYHRLNPDWRVPAWVIGRVGVHHSIYEEDSRTDDHFELPDDLTSMNVRAGFRLGGREPSMTSPLAFEMSVWYQGSFRERGQRYGFGNDRVVQDDSHLFWARAFLKYTFEESQQYFDLGLTLGTSINADRFSAYRLGGVLPLVSEFPLSIPGYYYQELSADQFALLNFEYSFPFTPRKNWRLNFYGATAPVDFLEGMEQEENWHSGLGAGVTYVSPRGAWFVSLVYGYGIDAIRKGGKGANQVGILFQYDFDAVDRYRFRRFEPNVSPYSSRGGERLFR